MLLLALSLLLFSIWNETKRKNTIPIWHFGVNYCYSSVIAEQVGFIFDSENDTMTTTFNAGLLPVSLKDVVILSGF